MPLFDQRLLERGVAHGCTLASDGDMKSAPARGAFLSGRGIDPSKMLYLRQAHTDCVIRVTDGPAAARLLASEPAQADAWVLSAQGCGAAVFTADCAPVLLWDKRAQVFGLAHAGWRGTAKRIAAKTAALMLELGAEKPLRAFVGPRIQDCCFEVGPELKSDFQEQAFRQRSDRLYLDLGLAIKIQLAEAGLSEQDIALHPACTCCGADFFSYRRNKGDGRLMSYIFKK